MVSHNAKETLSCGLSQRFLAAFGVKTVQKYTFSLKQQIFGADFLDFHSIFRKSKMQKCAKSRVFSKTVDNLLTMLT